MLKEVKMVRSVFANVHQGCAIFQPYNGVQCTAVALIALVTFMQYMPYISNMSSNVLDQVVFDGTDLYRHILARGVGEFTVICLTVNYLQIYVTGTLIMERFTTFMICFMGL